MGRNLGPVLVVVGLGVVLLGVLAWSGGLRWFGNLPGDLRLGGERSRVFVPITSMLVVSVALNVVLWLVGRWR